MVDYSNNELFELAQRENEITLKILDILKGETYENSEKILRLASQKLKQQAIVS